MSLFEALGDLLDSNGPLGEMAANVLEGVVDCCNGIAENLDRLVDKLDETQFTNLEDGGGFDWEIDREDPEFESSSGLMATRAAVDSIVGFCDKASEVIEGLTEKIQDMTNKV